MIRLLDQRFSEVRGFNYQPSYAATGLEIWSKFDGKAVRREIALGTKYFPHTNTLRLWLSFDAFIHHPKSFIENFQRMLDVVGEHDLRAVPILFNNWHSIPDFGGVAAEMIGYWSYESRFHVFSDYLDAIVGHHRDDERILAWDLCNEPFNSGCEDRFLPWLHKLSDYCRALAPTAPLTIGVPGSVKALETVERFCDVLTPHSYFARGLWTRDEATFSVTVDEMVTYANKVGKPMFAGETGWGALVDRERTQTLEVELRELVARGLGYCIHILHHSLVADGHRPEYGVVSEAGFMGCIEADGALRAGHELINEY